MDTRTTLLDHAERAVRQRGYNGFSYADLARDVGIRKASIHHHFPKKADLAFSLIERYAGRVSERLAEICAREPTAAARLRAYHQLYRAALAGGAQVCLCVAFSAGRDSLTDPVLEQLNAFHRDSVDWLQTVFEQAAQDGSVAAPSDPQAEARATLALMEGAQLVSRAAKDVSHFDQATAAFVSRLSPAQIH